VSLLSVWRSSGSKRAVVPRRAEIVSPPHVMSMSPSSTVTHAFSFT
jgi:hypothetical protein